MHHIVPARRLLLRAASFFFEIQLFVVDWPVCVRMSVVVEQRHNGVKITSLLSVYV
jgi:hypothetical protein